MIDLYTDETHICGTSQFADEAVNDQLSSLAFTANAYALLPEEGVELPGQGNVDGAGFTPSLRERPMPVAEREEAGQSMEDNASTNPCESEAAEDLMTTRDVLVKATQSVSASQVLANRNQAELRKRQEELDLELRKQTTNSVSEAEFDEHAKKVLEYMAVVKTNTELSRDNVNLEMQKLQKQFGVNEFQQSSDMKKMRAELFQQQQAIQTGLKTDVQKLTEDMLGLAKNMNNIHDEMDGLNEHVSELAGNVDVLRTDIGTVAGHVETLGTKTEKQNQKLQQNLTKEMQGLFAEFKTSITGAMKSDAHANTNSAQAP